MATQPTPDRDAQWNAAVAELQAQRDARTPLRTIRYADEIEHDTLDVFERCNPWFDADRAYYQQVAS